MAELNSITKKSNKSEKDNEREKFQVNSIKVSSLNSNQNLQVFNLNSK